MTRRIPLLLTALATLGCGGLFLDAEGLARVVGAVKGAEPGEAMPLLTAGAVEVGLVNPLCAACLEPLPDADPAMRATLTAAALLEPTCACPSTCASGALAGGPAPMAEVAAACGGDDPVFAGPLAPLRTSVAPLDYALTRMVFEALPEDDRAALREKAALGLAGASGPFEPTPEPTVIGADPAVLTDRADALRACGTDVLVRLVVRPDGTVAHRSGHGSACAADLLAGATFPPADAWRVVDLTWAAESIAKGTPAEAPAGEGEGAAQGSGEGSAAAPEPEPAPAEPAPAEPAPAEPAPAEPAEPTVTIKIGAEVRGGLDAEVVRRVLQRAGGAFKACGATSGTFTITFTVGADGKAAAASAAGGDAAVGQCLSGKVMKLAFPEPSGGLAVITSPITFTSR